MRSPIRHFGRADRHLRRQGERAPQLRIFPVAVRLDRHGFSGRVNVDRVYVDAFCAQMVLRPTSIHVAVAENMFGDIISDLAAGIVGSLGLAPSGDIGDRHAVFQPSHGSAPTIAGKDEANPVATILSAAMMLDWLAGQALRQQSHRHGGGHPSGR